MKTDLNGVSDELVGGRLLNIVIVDLNKREIQLKVTIMNIIIYRWCNMRWS